MTTEVSLLLPAFVTGVAIGAFYFTGLWWTVKRLVRCRRPSLWALASFFLRVVVSLMGFYLVAGGYWAKIVVCLIGFLVARYALMRLWRPKPNTHCLGGKRSYGY